MPIPRTLSLETTLSPLNPYEESQVHSAAANFSGQEISTETLIVRGRHPDPEIDTIVPDTISSGEEFRIEGEHLAYSTLETEIRFISSEPWANVTIPVSSADSTELTNIQVPAGFDGYNGHISVQVITRHGTEHRVSNIKAIQYESCLESGTEYYDLLARGPGDDGFLWYGGDAPPPAEACTSRVRIRRVWNPNGYPATNRSCTIAVFLTDGEYVTEEIGLISPGDYLSSDSLLDANAGFKAALNPEELDCNAPIGPVTLEVDWTSTY